MNKKFLKKHISCWNPFITSCRGKNTNNDFDLSGLKIPVKKTTPKNGQSDNNKSEIKKVQNNLIPLDKREIITSIKFGKENPFPLLIKKITQNLRI